MKKILLVVFSVFLLVAFAFGAPSDRQRKAIAKKLYGCIYVEDNPVLADYCVYVEANPVLSDLYVYVENHHPLWADRSGRWYYVNNPALADFRICYVDNPVLADIGIYYVDYPEGSGPNPRR